MINQIEQYKNEVPLIFSILKDCDYSAGFEAGFEFGFDKAINLNLAPKFGAWYNSSDAEFKTFMRNFGYQIEDKQEKADAAYKYWVKNILIL